MSTISVKEFEAHATAENAWIVIDGDVYDVSKFAAMHPGGAGVLLEYAGKDATDAFYGLHRHEVLEKFRPRLLKGRLAGAAERNDENTPLPVKALSEIPYGEASAFQGAASPYWDESHVEFRKAAREWITENLRETAIQLEKTGKLVPDEIFLKLGEVGILAGRLGPGEAMQFAPPTIFGVKKEDFTYFHEMILHEEVARLGTPGFTDGIGSGICIGLPVVLHFGSEHMIQKVAPDVLSGRKSICLAITEPYAGSDVANIRTRAVKSADGSHFVVNGVKKWITSSKYCADGRGGFFTTLVRTGGEGAGGLSFLLIEDGPGVEVETIKTSYSTTAGTGYITFDNVKVPAENVIGVEGGGFIQSMQNFVAERLMICAYINAGSRGMIDECFKWATQRRAFGKPLMSQPVIRQKLANMVAQLESVYAWQENLTYQRSTMPYQLQSAMLAGPVGLLKYQCTRVAHAIADDAVQIFGGRAITQNGMGINVERFMRTYKFAAILGGSEEVMADMGIRMAAKKINAAKSRL